MMQAAARRFRHWFHRSEQAGQAHTAPEDDGLPRAVPAAAPLAVGPEDTAPVDIEAVLPPPPPRREPSLPSPRSNRSDADGAVANPVKEVSEWSAVIAAAKRRCETSGHG
jgi:hypothetical protein